MPDKWWDLVTSAAASVAHLRGAAAVKYIRRRPEACWWSRAHKCELSSDSKLAMFPSPSGQQYMVVVWPSTVCADAQLQDAMPGLCVKG